MDPDDNDVKIVVEENPDKKIQSVDKHDGDLDSQCGSPGTPYYGPEPCDLAEFSEVPDMDNSDAPRFAKHEHHLTPNAIRCRARRIFTPRVDGSKKVSETIFKEWHGRGQPRKDLESIFKQCGYDPESLH